MTTLARRLRTLDYFALGFGSMVGVGWLVVMDDWLGRGGPLGAILGFALGGLLLLPVGHVYARLTAIMPDAGGEATFAARAFPPWVGFAAGWTMLLAYLVVCPWEAVAIGRIASRLFPALDQVQLYRVMGRPVYLPHVAIGFALTAGLVVVNLRGIRPSASFQKIATLVVLALCLVFVGAGAGAGSRAHFAPLFSGPGPVAVLLVLQVVPYYMTGFESVAKTAEEAGPEQAGRGFRRAIFAAIAVGVLFYVAVIAAVALAAPWRSLAGEPFPTAVALRRAVGSRWIVDVVMATALVSLLKVFNGNFVAATRLLFALGRRGLLDERMARLHPVHRTPTAAIVVVGLASAALSLLGPAALVPISEVGSVACALGWLVASASWRRICQRRRERAIATAAALVSALLVGMKLVPGVPGSFSVAEWVALAAWAACGLQLYRGRRLLAAAG